MHADPGYHDSARDLANKGLEYNDYVNDNTEFEYLRNLANTIEIS